MLCEGALQPVVDFLWGNVIRGDRSAKSIIHVHQTCWSSDT